MRKVLTMLVSSIICVIMLTTLIYAVDENAVYVSSLGSDTAAGTSNAPVATLGQAYAKIGNADGVIYILNEIDVTATVDNCFVASAHSGNIKIMSAENSNGALNFTDVEHVHFNGDTELRDVEIIANELVITSGNNTLKMGEDLTVSSPINATEYRGGHAYCGAKLHIAAYTPCDNAAALTTVNGDINVYSGEYRSVSAFYGDTVTVTGGESKIYFGTKNDTDSIWVRYICPGLYNNAKNAELSATEAKVIVIADSGLNTAEPYRFTKGVFSGSMTVDWILKTSPQGNATALVSKDFEPATGAAPTLNIYISNDNSSVASAKLLMRNAKVAYSGENSGDVSSVEYCDFHGEHIIPTEPDGRLVCQICNFEQCRHLTKREVVTTPATCTSYGVYTTYCTDICKEELSSRTISGYNYSNHVGCEIYYRYSEKYDYMAYRCKGCDTRIGLIERENFNEHIIIGDGGTDYNGDNLPPTDGSSFHFETYEEALKYIKVACNMMYEMTIEFRGNVLIPYAIDLPEIGGQVHFTGSQNARLIFDCRFKRIRMNDDMIIDNIKFAEPADEYPGIVICAQNNKLIMGEGITTQDVNEDVAVHNAGMELDVSDLYVIGGFPGATNETVNSDITIRSGKYRFIGGWNYNSSTCDGKAKITIGKTNPGNVLSVEYFTPFSRGDGYITQQAETTIIIDGAVDVERFYVTTLNLATADIPYVTNIILKGDITGTFDIIATDDNDFNPVTILNVYTDYMVSTTAADLSKFTGPSRDGTLTSIGATVNSYTYEYYCVNVLNGHFNEDGDFWCDECGVELS